MEHPEQWRWSSYLATGGRQRPHPCLSTGWILRQFGELEEAAQKEYRRFVREGMSRESLWKEVRAQSILGTDRFVEKLIDYVKGHEEIPEISKAQRYLGRPGLGQLFVERVLRDMGKRNEKVEQAVGRYGYTQREVADYLGMHFSSISRIMRQRKTKGMSRK